MTNTHAKTNVLNDQVFRVKTTDGSCEKRTLPGLLDLISKDKLDHIPALRTYQVHTIHMFLAQLISLLEPQIAKNGEAEWRDALLKLDDHPHTWQIFPEMGEYGFMQPAFPSEKGLKVKVSLSEIDLLVLSKAHDVKKCAIHDAGVDDWIWQIVTLQTGAGYPGAKNYGVFRMYGGLSSRSLWAVYDRSWGMGRRIMEDALLVEDNAATTAETYGFAKTDGLKLMWTAPWAEGDMLKPQDLDQRVIEICRRVNLGIHDNGQICAIAGSSGNPRTAIAQSGNAYAMRGDCGDVWAPIVTEKSEEGTQTKSFKMDGRGLPFDQVARLAIGRTTRAEVTTPSKAVSRIVKDPILVIAGVANGQGKTEGFYRREITFGKSESTLGPFSLPSMGETAEAMILDVKKAQSALRFAVKIFAGHDISKSLNSSLDARIIGPFTNLVDAAFFDHLQDLNFGKEGARVAWIRFLFKAGSDHLEKAFTQIPVRNLKRMHRITQATSAFRGSFWSDKKEPSFAPWREEVLNIKKDNTDV